MGKYEVYSTNTFDKICEALDNNELEWLRKIKNKLEENVTGKILKFSWFWEKKYLNKRLHYLIDEESKRILFVSFASKKEQQNIIAFITANINQLFIYLRSF